MRAWLIALTLLAWAEISPAQVSPWTSAQTSTSVTDNTIDFGSSTNRNALTTVRIGNNASETVHWRILLNFAGSIADSIYDTVDSLKLSFTVNSETFTSGDSIQVYALTQAWTETGSSYANRDTGTPWTTAGGTFGATPILTFSADLGTGRKTIRLDAWGQSLADGAAQLGLLFKRKTEAGIRFSDWVSDNGTAASMFQVVVWSHNAPSDGPPDPVTAILGFEDLQIGINAPSKIGIEP